MNVLVVGTRRNAEVNRQALKALEWLGHEGRLVVSITELNYSLHLKSPYYDRVIIHDLECRELSTTSLAGTRSIMLQSYLKTEAYAHLWKVEGTAPIPSGILAAGAALRAHRPVTFALVNRDERSSQVNQYGRQILRDGARLPALHEQFWDANEDVSVYKLFEQALAKIQKEVDTASGREGTNDYWYRLYQEMVDHPHDAEFVRIILGYGKTDRLPALKEWAFRSP